MPIGQLALSSLAWSLGLLSSRQHQACLLPPLLPVTLQPEVNVPQCPAQQATVVVVTDRCDASFALCVQPWPSREEDKEGKEGTGSGSP